MLVPVLVGVLALVAILAIVVGYNDKSEVLILVGAFCALAMLAIVYAWWGARLYITRAEIRLLTAGLFVLAILVMYRLRKEFGFPKLWAGCAAIILLVAGVSDLLSP